MNGLMNGENLDLSMELSGDLGLHKTESSIDQISEVINQIRANPDSRRLIVSAWNVSQIDSMALPPCHAIVSVLCC